MKCFSIIIPVYNEEDNIVKLINEIYSLDFAIYDFEILVVDDQSSDNTFSLLKKCQKKYSNLKVLKHDDNKGQSFALKTGINSSLYNNIITISPFSAQYSKDWPIENYSSLIPRLQENGYEIWLLSSPRDHSKLEELNKQLKVKCKLFPNTSIFDVISLISFCNTMICGDSGLLHAASALNKKVIGLYGPTNPEFSPPLTKVKCVLKGSCNSKNISLISDIKINDVYQAVIKLQ